MNHNPWYVDGVASYERDRIRQEMKQIRLQEAAMKASRRQIEEKTPRVRGYRPGPFMRIVLTTLKWLIP